jgi:prepilin peptidase CpaA
VLLPVPSNAVVIAAVAGSGAASAAVDLRTRRVPNWLTLTIAGVGINLAAAHLTSVSVFGALGGCAVGLLLMMPGHLIGATGAGDVKLFAAVGTLLGPAGIGVAFVYTAILGGVLAVVVAIYRGRLHATLQETATLVMTGGSNVAHIERPTADNRFAYAPAIAIGTFVAALGV